MTNPTTDTPVTVEPCPFCGWLAKLFDSGEAPFWVECSDCFAQGAPEDTAHEAITAWNTRLTTSPELEALREALASDGGREAEGLLVDQAWLDRRQAEPDECVEAGPSKRLHVMPGDPPHLAQTALQWYLKYDFAQPHTVRESNIAVQAFKDGYRAALAQPVEAGEDETVE